MNAHPHGSLVRVLHNLGGTLLDAVHGGARDSAAIGGIVIHDPVEDSVPPAHALVLGVGLREPEEIARLLGELGRRRAVALVVRAPVTPDARVKTAAEESGVGVLGLTPGASWVQVAAMLRAVVAEGDVGGPDTLGGTLSGDLFALANAIAALIDAPVTIEDRHSRVLAFSGQQHKADASRTETILGRQVPERFSRMLRSRGVFRDLYRSDGPVDVPPLQNGSDGPTVPRVAIAVRAGDEAIGSIWAAVREPLSPERSQALRDSAKVVALHLLRLRAGADVERRLRADLVSTALEGRAGAREALSRLGLADHPVVVLALGLRDSVRGGVPSGADAGLTTEREHLADAFAMHLGAVHPHSAAALLGDTAYGLVPAVQDRDAGEERAVRTATDFLDRVGTRTAAVIGIGPIGGDAGGLAQARSGADRALRVLRAQSGERRVARLADVHVEALLCELRDIVAVRGDEPTGPIARLAAYDERRGANLIETLGAWLDAFGDISAAAAAVHVHPNTFRYRLNRLAEVGGIDLDDPEARFAAMLQLRVMPPR
ncbi:PucR family transcriptional regulator [Streptomyces sediminimaris]|uniref:PucR family transcriptional regulator n=1 Tax=Streptomyces sediminimaris TaxID=3383721 RepID=UPI0039999B51